MNEDLTLRIDYIKISDRINPNHLNKVEGKNHRDYWYLNGVRISRNTAREYLGRDNTILYYNGVECK